MPTVFCTHVFPNGEIYRYSGETVVVGDLTYVKRTHLTDLELRIASARPRMPLTIRRQSRSSSR
jgi:hypothetical protein